MANDGEAETRRRILVEKEILAQAEMARQRVEMELGIEKHLKEQKEAKIKQNQKETQEKEKSQLWDYSGFLRDYLDENLVPFLADGLVEVCSKQPDDPVDALAEFLFKRSLDVPYPDPNEFGVDEEAD